MGHVDTSDGKRRRNKRWPEALKREIVAATRVPGASVSKVARQYDVNANQVFMWRRRYRDVGEQPALQPPLSTPALVPVTITPEPERPRLLRRRRPPRPPWTRSRSSCRRDAVFGSVRVSTAGR